MAQKKLMDSSSADAVKVLHFIYEKLHSWIVSDRLNVACPVRSDKASEMTSCEIKDLFSDDTFMYVEFQILHGMLSLVAVKTITWD